MTDALTRLIAELRAPLDEDDTRPQPSRAETTRVSKAALRAMLSVVEAAERAVAYYPHGVNPDLDNAISDIRKALSRLTATAKEE